jgi:MazG family protein
MSRLRTECPWDRKQTFADLSGYLLEECHEALDALARGNLHDLEGELGDLYFQIVFLAELGRESDAFDLASVAERIHAKMVSRHPHVFGETEVADAEAVKVQWEKLKEKERSGQAGGEEPPSPFAGVPRALPALLKAVRVTSRAADLGFDWQRDADVLAKLDEEWPSSRPSSSRKGPRAIRSPGDRGHPLHGRERRAAARHRPRGRPPDDEREVREALRGGLPPREASGREVGDIPLEELDRTWDEVKRDEAP